MKERRKQSGITLIALIVTIIVLIVLAVVSINAIFGADGLVAQARRTNLIVEFTIYLEEKKTYDSEKKYEDSNYDAESLNAGRTTLSYNTQEGTGGNIQTVIPSMDDEYAGMFEIIKGEFYLYAASELEREVATELGIEVSPYLIDNGVLLSANANLGLQTENGVVTLQERVTEIGQGAFSGVTGLKEVIIPGTVKVIQNDAFSNNTEIEKVTIEDGVLSIGNRAFEYCSNLTEITIPDSVLSIEGAAFYGCSKLDNIQIPASVTLISSSSFERCTSLYNLTIDEANEIYEAEGGIIYTKDNSTLIMLAPMAERETVTIREGIKRLNNGSLSMCTSMTTLNLPSSLEHITGLAFPTTATTLETINISESNEHYYAEDGYIYSKDGAELVYVVPTKTEININKNVETINIGAMYVINATELIIPDNVITIENSVFSVGRKLERIYIGKGVSNLSNQFKTWAILSSSLKIIIDEANPYYKVEDNLILTKDGKEVVTYIRKVQSQVVPEGIEKLQDYAFSNLLTATEIILPTTLKEIGPYCFQTCAKLVSIDIPSNVETIGTNAFVSCAELAEIRIDKEKDSISGSPWSVPKGERAIIWIR